MSREYAQPNKCRNRQNIARSQTGLIVEEIKWLNPDISKVSKTYILHLAYLSTKCSMGAIVIGLYPASGVCLPGVNNFFKMHLLLHNLINVTKYSQACSSWGPLLKLQKRIENCDCHGNQKKSVSNYFTMDLHLNHWVKFVKIHRIVPYEVLFKISKANRGYWEFWLPWQPKKLLTLSSK